MVIELLKDAGIYEVGDVVDVERRRAVQYIAAGLAKEWKPAAPDPTPELAPKKRATPKSKKK